MWKFYRRLERSAWDIDGWKEVLAIYKAGQRCLLYEWLERSASFIEGWKDVPAIHVCLCLSLLPWGRDQPLLGITGVQFYQTELRPVRRANANANLDRFQHNVILARRKPTLNMGEYWVALTWKISQAIQARLCKIVLGWVASLAEHTLLLPQFCLFCVQLLAVWLTRVRLHWGTKCVNQYTCCI